MRGAWGLLVLAGCANLDARTQGACGNAVLDPGEDCDTVVDPTFGDNLACDSACHYVTTDMHACPHNWKADATGTCNHGNGTFSVGSEIRASGAFYDLADVDGDGNLDLIVAAAGAASGASSVEVRFGTADGRFGAPLALSALDSSGIATGDVDGDGRADLVFGWETGLAVLLGQQDQQLRPLDAPTFTLGSQQTTVIPLRADGQRRAQLVALTPMVNSLDLSVVGGAGVHASIPPPALLDLQPLPHANIDRDPARDGEELAIGEGLTVHILSLTPDGQGVIERAQIGLPPGISGGPFFGDADGDGNVDVIVRFVVFSNPDIVEHIGVALGHGDGTFGPVTTVAILDGVAGEVANNSLLGVADLDGDGVADYVFCDGIATPHAGVVDVHRFVDFNCPTTMRNPPTVLGDFNHDGRIDIARAFSDSVTLSYNLAPDFLTTITIPVSTAELAVRTGDFDGDGIDDLAVRQYTVEPTGEMSRLDVIYGVVQGQPAAPVEIARVTGRATIEAAPLQATFLHDGLTDLVVETGSTRSVFVLEGQPGHTMIAPFAAGTAPTPKTIVRFSTAGGTLIERIHDPDQPNGTRLARIDLARSPTGFAPLTLDGVPADFCTVEARCALASSGPLLIAADGPNGARVFVGHEVSPGSGDLAGAYVEVDHGNGATRARRAVVADLDDDGHPDLVVVMDTALVVLRGIDDLSSAQVSRIPAPAGATFVDAVPIDADADPALELVVATTAGLVLLDQTAEHALVAMGPVRGASVTSTPVRLFVADVDHDSIDDIVFVDAFGVHVLLGNRGPVDTSPSCGNGVRDPGEVCDDGNRIDGDGCSANCLSAETCGNGIVDPGELCDDGNVQNGDGCAADCRSNETCGNGITDAGEQCDDGNVVSGDGCSSTCQREP